MEVIAHRGASAYAKELTVEAFDLAIEQGAHRLELDVRITAAGELALVHDRTLLRTAGDPRAVRDVALAELDPSVRPLTLGDVLDRYGSSTEYLVELKDPEPGWERAVPRELRRRDLERAAVVQSFDVLALARMRRGAPWLRCAALYDRRPAAAELAAVAGVAEGAGIAHGQIDLATVAAAHAHGLTVRAWTVNAPGDMDRVIGLGVDGLITDAPDLAMGAAATVAAPALAA